MEQLTRTAQAIAAKPEKQEKQEKKR